MKKSNAKNRKRPAAVAGEARGSASFAGLHPWWKIANTRRSELIGRKHNPLAKPLTEIETLELKQLQELAGMVRNWLTPTIPERLMPNAKLSDSAATTQDSNRGQKYE